MENAFDSGYYTLKDASWLENQKVAGKVLKDTISLIGENLKPGKSTKEINDLAETFINSFNGCSPTFKNYNGFPAGICISINRSLVHGIPSENIIIKDGDIIKIDSGVTYKKAIADMARTFIVGESSERNKLLVTTCKEALDNSLNFLNENIGTARIGDIGYIINKTAKKIGANVIIDLTGHSLEEDTPHWFPFIFNNGEKNKGIKIRPGMTLCIEPMLTYGSPKIYLQDDHWTINLEEMGAHEEDTIFVHERNIEIITR